MVERVNAYAPHDLLRVDPGILAADAPDWARSSLERAPWVVVRRACEGSTIPVGIRGAARGERYAARMLVSQIRCSLTPYVLQARVAATARPIDRAGLLLRAAATRAGLQLGFVGSYGFELASGARTTHDDSDLDAIVAAAPRVRMVAFAQTCELIATVTGVRLDIEVLLSSGGAALHEVAGSNPTILVKTQAGPVLLPCPA